MGNCLIRNNKISAQEEDYESSPVLEAKAEQIKTCSSSKLEPSQKKERMKKKKQRFKIEDDDRGRHSNSTRGTTRIRLVVTKQELKRILSYQNDAQHTSLKQLLSTMKLRSGTRMCEVGGYDGSINSWRPALESIPEDRSMRLK